MVVTSGERVLFGQRRIHSNSFEWQLPGGWIELGELPQNAACREVYEETGLVIEKPILVAVTNNLFSAQKHSISLCFQAKCCKPEALVNREPEKCLGWYWKSWFDINDNLFLPLQNLKKSDYRPYIGDKCERDISFL